MEVIPVLLALLLLFSVLVAENQPRSGSATSLDQNGALKPDAEWGLDNGVGDSDVMLIGTADGNLHALNGDNEEMWTAPIPGGALASSFKSSQLRDTSIHDPVDDHEDLQHSAGSNNEGGVGDDDNVHHPDMDYNVIPTLDGSILIHSNAGMRKTSVTARMLSEQEPYVSDDGLIYTGQRTDRYFGLDLESGRILHDSLNPEIGRANALTGLRSGGHSSPSIVGKSRALVGKNNNRRRVGGGSQLWIGRTDYTLRAFNELTGHEEFNVTYSELNPIGSKLGGGSGGSGARGSLVPLDSAGKPKGAFHQGKAGGRLAIGHPGAAGHQQALPVLSTPDGDVFFTDGVDGELHSVSLGSPAVNAFRVGKRGGSSSSTDREQQAYIQMLKVHHRMMPLADDVVAGDGDGDGDGDASAAGDGGKTVLVRSLNDGGLYALEIEESDAALALVSRIAREFTDYGENSDGDIDVEEGNGSDNNNDVDDQQDKDEDDANGLLRNKGIVFPGSRDAGGSLKMKEPKLQHTGGSLARLGTGSHSSSKQSSDLDNTNNGGRGSLERTRQPVAVGSHKLSSGIAAVDRFSEELSVGSFDITDISGDISSSGSSGSGALGNAVDASNLDGASNPMVFGGSAEFDKFLLSVEQTQEAERDKEREFVRLREEQSSSLKARALYVDSLLFGNTSTDSLSLPMILLLSILITTLSCLVVFVTLLLLMRFQVALPAPVVDAVYAVLTFLLDNSGSIEVAGLSVSVSTLLNAKDAERLQGAAHGLAADLKAETEAKSRVEMELERERDLAEAKRRAEEEPQMQTDAFGRQVMVVGSIQISETVLGYGSMGTVVLKGSLNGRPVAVKRMLSQMNKSAEREIALLIKSDGHPNVVRYFLCEKKREFVYLALQLCKMSLRDFVSQVQRAQVPTMLIDRESSSSGGAGFDRKDGTDNRNVPNVSDVPAEARTALLQIAEGLAHLHSQRIVHRDIKPHNILCGLPDDAVEREEALQMAKGKATAALGNHSSETDSTATTEEKEGQEDSGKVADLSHLGRFILKISDMGLSKQLDTGDVSFASMSINPSRGGLGGAGSSSHASGSKDPVGTVGWQAPELMAVRNGMRLDNDADPDDNKDQDDAAVTKKDRRTQTVDVFSLGCVFHYVLVPGEHPFGQWYEREANIMSSKLLNGLRHLDAVPDAADLIRRMLAFNERKRPSSAEVCRHPFFWGAARRLDFFTDLSDLLEHASANKQVLFAIEQGAVNILGGGINGWGDRLHHMFLDELGRYRKYDFGSVKDLLRVMRNKRHHYLELSPEMQQTMGQMPAGFLSYFERRFPLLLIHCVKVVTLTLAPQASKNPVSPTEKIFDDYCSQLYPVFSTCKEDVDRFNGDITAPRPTTVMGATTGASTTQASAPSSSSSSTGHSIPSAPALDLEPYGGTTFEAAVAYTGQTNARGRSWWSSTEQWVTLNGHVTGNGDDRFQSPGRPLHITRSSTDARYRSRLCTHWENTGGAACPMRKKGKCDFAHGPWELRIRDTRRDRWMKNLASQRANEGEVPPQQGAKTETGAPDLMRVSGGEDVLGAARSIEKTRANEGSVSEFERNSMNKSGGNYNNRGNNNSGNIGINTTSSSGYHQQQGGYQSTSYEMQQMMMQQQMYWMQQQQQYPGQQQQQQYPGHRQEQQYHGQHQQQQQRGPNAQGGGKGGTRK